MIRAGENKKEQITFLTLTFFVVYSCSYLLSDTFGRFMLRYGNRFGKSAGQLYESCFYGAGTDSGDNASASC